MKVKKAKNVPVVPNELHRIRWSICSSVRPNRRSALYARRRDELGLAEFHGCARSSDSDSPEQEVRHRISPLV
jgi:hypothetical protein